MNRPSMAMSQGVLVLIICVVVTHRSFLEHHRRSPPLTGEFTHIRSLMFPFAEMEEESSCHHPRNTVKVVYSALLSVNGDATMLRTEDLRRWRALPWMSLAIVWNWTEERLSDRRQDRVVMRLQEQPWVKGSNLTLAWTLCHRLCSAHQL